MKSGPLNPQVPRRVGGEAEIADLFYQTFTQEQDEPGADLNTYLQVLRRRKWLFVTPLCVILPLVGLLFYRQQPRYMATATLLIEPVYPSIAKIEEVLKPDASSNYAATQYELIGSYAVAEKTFDTVQVQRQAQASRQQQAQPPHKEAVGSRFHAIVGFLRKAIHTVKEKFTADSNTLPPESPETRRYKRISALQGRIKVEPLKGTRLVNVNISGFDPERVTVEANTLIESYVALHLEKKFEAARKASIWLSKELQKLKESLRNAEMTLQNFMESRGFAPSDLSESKHSAFVKPFDLKSSYVNAKEARIGLQTKLEELEQIIQQPLQNIQSMTLILDRPLVRSLQRRYADFAVELTNLSKKFGEKHHRIVALRAQIAQVQKSLELEIRKVIDSIRTEYNVAFARERALETTLGEEKKASFELSKGIAEYLDLKRNVETKRTLYDDLLRRLHETEITKGIQTNNVQIIQKAAIPLTPIPSGNVKKFLLSFIVTLGFGAVFAFVAEKLDKRFTNLDDARQDLQMPFLGLIPHHTTGKRRRSEKVRSLSEPRSIEADAYRQVRTTLQFVFSQHPIGSLVITSAIPGEGKSTTVANLGASFAQLGKTVLLVDADLRRPTLHEFFHLTNSNGLSDILISGNAWHHLIEDTKVENLKVLTSGLKPHNPTELLSTRRMKTLISSLKDAFDLVIYDAPLVLSVPDAAVLAGEMDGVLLVHHLNRGNKETALAAKQILENAGANILGIIFNDVDLQKVSPYYSQYYYDYDIDTEPQLVAIENHENHIADFSTIGIAQESLPVNIGEIGRDAPLVITIHSVRHQNKIDDTSAGDAFSFLIIDINFFNESDSPCIFNASRASINLSCRSKYGKAVRNIYNLSNEKYDRNKIYKYNPINIKIKNSLYEEELIPSRDMIRGFLIYEIPQEVQNFNFEYESDNISVHIPLVVKV